MSEWGDSAADWGRKLTLIVTPEGRIVQTLGEALDAIQPLPDSPAKKRALALLGQAANGLVDPSYARVAVASLLFDQ